MSARVLTCAERDAILIDPETGRVTADWSVASGFTDLFGEFGEPRIETTWERDGRQVRDVRHPNRGGAGPDIAPCEHYEMEAEQ